MGINKVVYGNDTLIDISEDTVTPANVLAGVSFHSANGEEQTGSLIARKVTDTVKADLDSLISQSDEGDLIIVTDEEADDPIPYPYEDYSLEEKVIGKFINGKPLYRKVVLLTSTTQIPTSFTSIKELQSIGIDYLTRLDFLGDGENTGALGVQSGIYSYVKNGAVMVKGFSSFSTLKYAIIEYTKTADAVDSFSPDLIVG